MYRAHRRYIGPAPDVTRSRPVVCRCIGPWRGFSCPYEIVNVHEYAHTVVEHTGKLA